MSTVDPADLRREARARKQAQEDAIQHAKALTSDGTYDPCDAAVVQARQALRTVYMALLMTCTFTRAAQLVDIMIWHDTTYHVISYLRARIVHAEQQVTNAPRGKGRAPKRERKSAKASDHKRLQQQLLQFIDEEVAYYAETIACLVQRYALDETCSVLSALAIQIQPQHEASLAESARVPAHRHQLYEIIQRLLTCMGDLHRYRELHSAVPDRHHRVFFHFTRAVLFYHQAHVLLPDHGNPSNQLAVVATTVGDSFGAVYQYYRALCVRVPFDNARHNLQRMLEKALHAWSSSARRDDVLVAWRQAALEDCPARRVPVPSISARWDSTHDYFDSLVAFHSLCFLRADLDTACVLHDAILRHMLMAVDMHELRAVDYLRILVTGLCASWTTRLCPAPLHERLPFSLGAPYSAHMDADVLAEHVRAAWGTLLVCHVLGMLTALLAVIRHELMSLLRDRRPDSEAGPMDVGRILRRTLPSVRIGLKWVRGHVDYMASCRAQAAQAAEELQQAVDQQKTPSSLATDAVARLACVQRSVEARMSSFWSALIDFGNLLQAAYPPSVLPVAPEASIFVEEDVDLQFLGPIRRVMHPTEASPYALPDLAPLASAHADYARVLDVERDIRGMATSEACGLVYDEARAMFVSRAAPVEADDPIELAMRAMDVHMDHAWSQSKPAQDAPAWPSSTWTDPWTTSNSIWTTWPS